MRHVSASRLFFFFLPAVVVLLLSTRPARAQSRVGIGTTTPTAPLQVVGPVGGTINDVSPPGIVDITGGGAIGDYINGSDANVALPANAVVSASSYNNGATTPGMLIDNDLNTYWQSSYGSLGSSFGSAWIQLDFGSQPRRMAAYELAATSNDRRQPIHWELYGSNDGNSWVSLHSTWVSSYSGYYGFQVPTTQDFRYFRLYFDAVRGGGGPFSSPSVVVHEWKLYAQRRAIQPGLRVRGPLQFDALASGGAQLLTTDASGIVNKVPSPTLAVAGRDLSISNGNTVTVPGDDLGSHTATQNLNLVGFRLFGVGSTNGLWFNTGTLMTDGPLTVGGKLNLGANQLVGNGGTTGLGITSTGKVGIGTTSPFARLSLGTGNALNSTATNLIALSENANGTGFTGLGWMDINGPTLAMWGGTGTKQPYSNDNTAPGRQPDLVVSANGNVGVNMPEPQEKLHVIGNVRISTLANNGSQVVVSDANGNLKLSTMPLDAQQLSKAGNQIFLSNGGSVYDSDNQSLSLTGASLGLTGGSGVTLPDASATNELQTLSVSGPTLTISGVTGAGASVTLPSADNLGNHTATQAVRLNGNWLSNDGGAEGLRIDNNGNVGVGVATPASRVSLGNAGAANSAVTRIANSENASGALFYGTGLVSNGAQYGLGLWGGTGLATPWDGTSGTTAHLLIESTGNVGIGTTSPTAKLDINGSLKIRGGAPGAGKLLVSDATGLASWQAVPGAGAWTLNGTDLYTASATEVGIGTTAPARPLDVVGPTTGSYQMARFTSLNGVGTGLTLTCNNGLGRSYTLLSTGPSAGSGAGAFGLFDENAGSYRWVVNAAGQMGIGTGSPTKRLDVNGDAVIRGTLEVTSTVSFCGGLYTCSDRRYKKDITPLQSALANVMKLNGYTYFWRQDEFKDKGFTADRQLGFIAQELEQLYPEMVLTDPQTGYKAVDYARLTPVLVEAIKELKGQLDRQAQQAAQANERAQRAEAVVQTFESRLRALESGGMAAQK